MTLNESFRFVDDSLYCDDVDLRLIAEQVGTPVYVYSLPRIRRNLQRIRDAFAEIDAHIHYSAKANANLTVLRTVLEEGVGIDVVSAGEIFRTLHAGAAGKDIVFAGVGKRTDEIQYALENGVGWFNVENVAECRVISDLAAGLGLSNVRIALRLNPEVTANTHPYIATGHGGAKFGLTAEVISQILAERDAYQNLQFAGIHVHIGSQLHDTLATSQAVKSALELMRPYADMRTINIGGGLPVAYSQDEHMPDVADFVDALKPLVEGYRVILEPGRSIVADAGVLITELLYIKSQAGQMFYVVDASMTEIMRPALYQAKHDIVPLHRQSSSQETVQIVGPVCETTDVLRRDTLMPRQAPGAHLAILTAGAYGMVMANTYNARPRPPEVVINSDGGTWSIARRRETMHDLLSSELNLMTQ